MITNSCYALDRNLMGRAGVSPAFFSKVAIVQAGRLLYPRFLQGLTITA